MPFLRLVSAALWSLVWLGAAEAWGQLFTPAPTTRPAEPLVEPRPRGPLSIDDLTVTLGVDGELSRRKVHSDGARFDVSDFRQLNEATRLQETLGVRTSGSLLDDRALRYDAMVRWGLSQETYDESRPGPDLHKSPDGQLLEYDIRLQAFGAGKLSVSGFASQLDDRIPRPFLPSLDRRRERYGGQILLNDARLPMQLTFEHLFDDLTSGSPWLADDEQRVEDSLRYEANWQPTDDHTLRLEYEYQDQSDRYSGTRTRFDTVRNRLALTDVVAFGADRRSRLETLARYEDESGELARDVAELAPRLTLQHTGSLSTNYGLQWLKESFQNLKTQMQRAEAGVTHEWKNQLVSTFNAYALRQDADENADVSEFGTIAQFAFSRENALGRFSSNLSYTHTDTKTNDGGRGGVVIGEAVTFRDPLPTYLAQGDVDRLTILVTDPQRIRVFVPGRDYIVLPVGRFTALARVPTGQILDRQTVLVTYTYRTYENFELSRDRVDLRIQQEFKSGLTPYYAGSIQQEDLDRRRFLTWQDRDVNRHRAGATFRRPRWSVGPEYEYNDDDIDPYRAFHFNADVAILQSASHQLSGRGTLSRFGFSGLRELRERDTTMLDLGLSYRCVLRGRLEGTATGAYRFETDSLFGRTQGVDLSASLAYRIGLFTLLFEVEYDSLDLPTSTDDTLAFWLKLQREIPVIGRRSP